MSSDTIQPGQVYIPTIWRTRHIHRRVIAIMLSSWAPPFGLRVYYSVGGDKNYSCSYHWFRRWAVLAQTYSPIERRQ